jgi:alanyl-tRNA synthetase
VRTFTTTLEHARDLGAMALFGEKYDDFVRVVEIDDFSRELCGGTHVGSTSELGAFKILSEGSVGANIRRIEAVTGREAVAYYRGRDALVGKAAEALGAADGDLLRAVERAVARMHMLEDQARASRAETARSLAQSLADRATVQNGVSVIGEVVEADDMEHLLSLVDQARDRTAPAVVVLGAELQAKGVLVVSVTAGVTGIDAGAIVKGCAQKFGGGGGGNAQLGRGGGSDPARLPEAVAAARQAVMIGLGAECES